jgi:hypothetical protein
MTAASPPPLLPPPPQLAANVAGTFDVAMFTGDWRHNLHLAAESSSALRKVFVVVFIKLLLSFRHLQLRLGNVKTFGL